MINESKKAKKAKKSDACVSKAEDATHIWKGYNLKALKIPRAAYPSVDRVNKGKHGYTVVSQEGSAVTGLDCRRRVCYVSMGLKGFCYFLFFFRLVLTT